MHIVVPLDGSSYSDAAAGVAIDLAAALKAQGRSVHLIGLHVVTVRVASGNLLADLPGRLGFEPAVVSAEVAEGHIAEGQKIVEAFAAQAAAKGLEVHQDVRAGSVPDVIVDCAADADLVVMGLRGETETKFPGQGGRLAALLPSRIDAPLLLVPPQTAHVHGVALGYDGSVGARHAVRALRRIAGPLEAPVHGIYVGNEEDAAPLFAELDEGMDPLEVTHHVVEGSPHDAIVNKARDLGADVVALGFTGHSKLKDFAFGTLTERALLEGSMAVLIA